MPDTSHNSAHVAALCPASIIGAYLALGGAWRDAQNGRLHRADLDLPILMAFSTPQHAPRNIQHAQPIRLLSEPVIIGNPIRMST